MHEYLNIPTGIAKEEKAALHNDDQANPSAARLGWDIANCSEMMIAW